MSSITVKEEDLGLNKLLASLKAFSGEKSALFVGVQFPNRRYANGTRVGIVGMAHEFGTESSRPPTTEKAFIRNTVARNRKKYVSLIQKKLRSELLRNRTISAKSLFLTLGPAMKKDIKNTVKGIGLIDTGLLLRSIGFRIAKESAK